MKVRIPRTLGLLFMGAIGFALMGGWFLPFFILVVAFIGPAKRLKDNEKKVGAISQLSFLLLIPGLVSGMFFTSLGMLAVSLVMVALME